MTMIRIIYCVYPEKFLCGQRVLLIINGMMWEEWCTCNFHVLHQTHMKILRSWDEYIFVDCLWINMTSKEVQRYFFGSSNWIFGKPGDLITYCFNSWDIFWKLFSWVISVTNTVCGSRCYCFKTIIRFLHCIYIYLMQNCYFSVQSGLCLYLL